MVQSVPVERAMRLHRGLSLFLLASCSAADPEDAVDTAEPALSSGLDTGTKGEQPIDPSPFTSTDPVVIHVATNGSDGNDGSASSPVNTLARAHAITAATGVGRDIEVRIAEGRYHHQQVRWTFTQPDHTVRILPAAGAMTKPIFDGCKVWSVGSDYAAQCDLSGYFLVVASSSGQPSNVYLENIQIQRYNQGIKFGGNKVDAALGNSRNRVFGCIFYNIGDAFNPSLGRGEAGISLSNSDDNVIEQTKFYKLRNYEASENRYLHAIYMNGYSSNNVVRDSYFHLCAGGPFRVRHASHFNKFHGNRTYATGSDSLVSDWYDETKNECPSYGTEVRRNFKNGNYACTAQPRNFDPSPPPASQPGCANPAAARFASSGNESAPSPCDSP